MSKVNIKLKIKILREIMLNNKLGFNNNLKDIITLMKKIILLKDNKTLWNRNVKFYIIQYFYKF